MTKYVRQMSAGEIVRGAMDLYRSNFWTLFLSYSIPITVLQLLFFPLLNQPFWLVVDYVVLFIGGLVAYAAIAISISDVCVGNKPTFARAYRYVLTVAPFTLLLACLLQTVVGFVGGMLLVVPGLIFAAWFMFAPVVVVLEKAGAIRALKRSKDLGEGFYLRNFSLLFVGILVLFMFILLCGAALGILLVVLKMESAGRSAGALLGVLLGGLFYPYIYTMMILMYYDMRARKESYDSTSLTEDLLR